MRHFDYLSAAEHERLFFRPPEGIGVDSGLGLLAVSLGATLYCPATRPTLAADLAKCAAEGSTSVVVCLEDAVADADLPAAELNAIAQLCELAGGDSPAPLIFVRVRAAAQIPMIMAGLGDAARLLAGFVLPKFTAESGRTFLDAVDVAQTALGRRLLVMPVLETAEVMFAEGRVEALMAVRSLLDEFRESVLAVRIGATDLSALYGLRRSREMTVYDVRVVADAIAEVVNILGRAEGGYVVTGPVWEYFTSAERLFKPQLRETPFIEHEERALRANLLAADLDGLLREVTLDKANGLIGKTVIHPTHVAAVHALSVVTHEEYADALDIVGSLGGGGVSASSYRNKMNEGKPHAAWAARTMLRARAFGVSNVDISFVDLLGAGLHR